MVGPVHQDTTIHEDGACAALSELMQLLLSTTGQTRDFTPLNQPLKGVYSATPNCTAFTMLGKASLLPFRCISYLQALSVGDEVPLPYWQLRDVNFHALVLYFTAPQLAHGPPPLAQAA
jgi:hypothetical protein